MESQMNYYNDMPEGVNVIDKMNEEFAGLQKQNELLKKENDELKRENDDAYDCGFEDGLLAQPGDAGLYLLNQRYEKIYYERVGMSHVPPGIAARARTREKIESAFLSWSSFVHRARRLTNELRWEKMRKAFLSWSLWVRPCYAHLRVQGDTFWDGVLSLRLRAPPPEPEQEREYIRYGVGYGGRAASPALTESDGEASNQI